MIGDRGQHLVREGDIVRDVSLAHQGGIGGEPLDHWVGSQRFHALDVGAVGENLDAETI